jgi:hypothetical protein
MEHKNHITFSFYYINESNEVDKILKNKYLLDSNCILTKEELFFQIIKHKPLYHSNVSLHEILLYENNHDPIQYIHDENPPKFFTQLNYNSELTFSTCNGFENLTRIYILYKVNSNPTKKIKKPLLYKNKNSTKKNK